MTDEALEHGGKRRLRRLRRRVRRSEGPEAENETRPRRKRRRRGKTAESDAGPRPEPDPGRKRGGRRAVRPEAPAEEAGGPSGNRSGAVAVVDGAHVAVFRFKRGDVTSSAIDKHADPLAAWNAGRRVCRKAGWRRSRLVWAGECSYRVVRAPADTHERVAALAAAQHLKAAFDGGSLCVNTAGGTAVRADLPEGARLRPKENVVAAGLCVGTEDGAWIRIGYVCSIAALVENGRTVSVQSFAGGVDGFKVSERVAAGETPDRALRAEAHRIVEQLRPVLTEWQREHMSPRKIWLCGPGDDAQGETETALREGLGRAVVRACSRYGFQGALTERQDLPTAVFAETSPLLRRPDDVLGAARRRTVRRRTAVAAAAAAVAVGLAWRSESLDRRAAEQADRLKAETAAVLAGVDPQPAALSAQAAATREALDGIAAQQQVPGPNWPLLLLLAQRDTSISLSEASLDMSTSQQTLISGFVGELWDWDRMVRQILRDNSCFARGGPDVTVDENGEVAPRQLTAVCEPPPEDEGEDT